MPFGVWTTGPLQVAVLQEQSSHPPRITTGELSENYKTRSFTICNLRQTMLGRANMKAKN